MRIDIANGVLTNDGEASGRPVFLLDGKTYGPEDTVDSNGARSPAGDLIAAAYEAAVEKGTRFKIFEYNLIAKFAGMPTANYCSGE